MMEQPEKDQTVVFQALKCPYALPSLYRCKVITKRSRAVGDFYEKYLRFGLVLGQLAILKKLFGQL